MVLLSGRFFSALFLRSSLSGALIHHMCCVGRLRKRCLVSVSVPLIMLSFLTGPAESLRVRVRAFPLLFRQLCRGFASISIPRHLTIRSSRPRVVASATCYALRLHVSAAPTQGGLTPALGGRKAFGCFSSQCSFSRLRLALRFGLFPAALLLRSGPSGALKPFTRYVGRLRKQ